jgi:hypothetical protein
VAGIPNGFDWLICAWLSAIANKALAAYLCDGVKFDVASTINSDQQKRNRRNNKKFPNPETINRVRLIFQKQVE